MRAPSFSFNRPRVTVTFASGTCLGHLEVTVTFKGYGSDHHEKSEPQSLQQKKGRKKGCLKAFIVYINL